MRSDCRDRHTSLGCSRAALAWLADVEELAPPAWMTKRALPNVANWRFPEEADNDGPARRKSCSHGVSCATNASGCSGASRAPQATTKDYICREVVPRRSGGTASTSTGSTFERTLCPAWRWLASESTNWTCRTATMQGTPTAPLREEATSGRSVHPEVASRSADPHRGLTSD